MNRSIRIAALLAALLPAVLLQAASQARLMGTITDAAGQPLEGATILVTTPSLTNFKLTLKSDKNGKYSTILNDATLPYHIKIEKDGFTTFEIDKKIAIGDSYVLDTKLVSGSGAPAKPAARSAGVAAPSPSDQAIASFNGGVDALNSGDKAAAETQFLDAAKKNPDLPAAWAALTQLAYEKKDWAKTL